MLGRGLKLSRRGFRVGSPVGAGVFSPGPPIRVCVVASTLRGAFALAVERGAPLAFVVERVTDAGGFAAAARVGRATVAGSTVRCRLGTEPSTGRVAGTTLLERVGMYPEEGGADPARLEGPATGGACLRFVFAGAGAAAAFSFSGGAPASKRSRIRSLFTRKCRPVSASHALIDFVRSRSSYEYAASAAV
jgi:hypothetical protein